MRYNMLAHFCKATNLSKLQKVPQMCTGLILSNPNTRVNQLMVGHFISFKDVSTQTLTTTFRQSHSACPHTPTHAVSTAPLARCFWAGGVWQE